MSSQRSQIRASTAFKPSTDGQNERSHRFVNDYLRAFISPRQNDWDELLPMAEFAYNARPHDSIGMSPFEADLGYVPRAYDDLAIPAQPQANRDVLRFSDTLQAVLQRCRESLASAQGRMKQFYDRNRPDNSISVGDQVLLDTTHLDLAHVGSQGRRKFSARFIGPYRVIAATTPNTYKISLPPGVRLHDEFHVSYLRRYVEDSNPNRLNNVPRLLTRDGQEGLQVRAIVGMQIRRGARFFKVQWYGRDEADSWEPESNLSQAAGLIAEYLASSTTPHRRKRSRRRSTQSSSATAPTRRSPRLSRSS